MAVTISIMNQKGGVGKTTTTVCLAYGLVEAGHRVLVIDLDPQANLTIASGLNPYEEGQVSVFEALLDFQLPVKKAIKPGLYGFDVLPANISLSRVEAEIKTNRERKLANKLSQLARDGESYDYILIDCPPTLGVLTYMALTASRYVLLPVQCQQFAIYGLNDALGVIREVREELNDELEVLGALPTMYQTNTRMSKDILARLKEAMPGKVFGVTIPTTTLITEMPEKGPLQRYIPEHAASKAYDRLTQEVMHYAAAVRA